MAERKWTPAQLDFINAERGPILVSAAAGSGKTASIVARVSRRLSDPSNPLAAHRLLMTTFSNAAANEMLSRIEAELEQKLYEDPDNESLKLQIEQMAEAQISTIHSFCLKIIRENFSYLGLYCDFRVVDEAENEMLMMSALERVMKRAYAQNDPNFYKLIELVCSSKNDYELSQVILKLYRTVIAMPFPEDVLKRWLESFSDTEESYRKWADIVIEQAKKAVNYTLELCHKNIDEIGNSDECAFVVSDIEAIREIEKALLSGDLTAAYAAAKAIKIDNRIMPKKLEAQVKERVKLSRETIRDTIKKLCEQLSYTDREAYCADQRILLPAVKLLFSLVHEFIQEFAAAKREKNLLDFSDAEQFMLNLVWRKNENGGYERTELANELRERFDEIYIDEYQDVNAAQDMIFRAIEPKSGNVFMVGDVKQSIYGFRQADADIFEDKKQSFADYDGEHFPAKIFFDSNFRSRSGVTDFVNQVFFKIMTEDSCGSSYTEADSLKAKADYAENGASGTTFLFYECPKGTREKEWLEDEARLIASEIHRLVKSGYRVKQGEGLRACRYEDFCILSRSDGNRFSAYAEALNALDIEVCVDKSGSDFLESREMLLVLSLLKAINNPYDDIALCSAMMSPIFLFSPAKLAELRGGKGKKAGLYDAVKAAADEGNTECIEFLKGLRSLQRLAAGQSVDKLLSILYDRYGLYNMIGAMNSGEERMNNLDMFRYYARRFEQNGYKGLSEFLRFINKTAQNNKKLKGGTPGGENRNAVNIMTIHKSKGLEFPICILANSLKSFNNADLISNTLIHKEFGFACMIKDDARAVRYAPLSYKALRLAGEQSQIAEELRILYVALTRAKEKLIIPVVRSSMDKLLGEAMLNAKSRSNSFAVCESKSYARWLMLSCVGGRSMQSVCNAFLQQTDCVSNDCGFEAKVVHELSCDSGPEPLERVASSSALIEEIRARARFVYPYGAQTTIPSKFSVSDLSKGAEEERFDFETKPDFMHEQGMSGAARGTALHTFMQFADFENACRDIEGELLAVRDKGLITEQQRAVIDISRLKTFFASPLCKRILAADAVFREYKFMTGMDSAQFGGERAAADSVVLQGIADCIIIEGDAATIIDYKTDFVKTEQQLLERYGMQLAIYRAAIEKMLGLAIKQCLIYSFCLGKQIQVETEQNII